MSEFFSLLIQDKHSPRGSSSAKAVGETGERLAAEFLIKNNFRLVAANFKIPVGRNRLGAQVTGEIDLIAYDAQGVLCFVEVKTRTSDQFAAPLAAVDLRKQRQITRTARIYRNTFRLRDVKSRYDVVSIVSNNSDSRPKIEIFKGFWTENKFAKKLWFDEF